MQKKQIKKKKTGAITQTKEIIAQQEEKLMNLLNKVDDALASTAVEYDTLKEHFCAVHQMPIFNNTNNSNEGI